MEIATETREPIITNEWTHPKTGQVRRYINLKQFFKIRYYNTGNLNGVHFKGEHISNRQAGFIFAAKLWIDENDKIHLDHYRANLDRKELLEHIKAEIAERGLA